MRATVMHGPGVVRIENVPDARIVEPTDAVISIRYAAICGSDLIEPGLVFDRVVSLDEVHCGYHAMDASEAIKVMVKL